MKECKHYCTAVAIIQGRININITCQLQPQILTWRYVMERLLSLYKSNLRQISSKNFGWNLFLVPSKYGSRASVPKAWESIKSKANWINKVVSDFNTCLFMFRVTGKLQPSMLWEKCGETGRAAFRSLQTRGCLLTVHCYKQNEDVSVTLIYIRTVCVDTELNPNMFFLLCCFSSDGADRTSTIWDEDLSESSGTAQVHEALSR